MMNNILFAALLAVLLPTSLAFAHERQAFEIGGKTYLFIIGSTGEPVIVDDKTSASVRVLEADPKDVGNSSSPDAKPVTGLETALKIELGAEGQKRELELSPAYNDPGHYTALFFPTKATVLTYRVFGNVNNTPVDLSFSCMPGKHVMGGVPNTENVEVSPGVKRVFQAGMFGCPGEKEALGFPLASQSVVGMEKNTEAKVSAIVKSIEAERRAAQEKFYILLGLSILALMIGLFAVVRLPSQNNSDIMK